MPTDKQYTHFKLIDGRSGMPMGFTFKVEEGSTYPEDKLAAIKEKASMKKNCPIQMIEVVKYRSWKKRN